MGVTRNFNRRGKFKKFKIGNILYFKSPSINGLRVFHYKQRIKLSGQLDKTTQITKLKYEKARNKQHKKIIK